MANQDKGLADSQELVQFEDGDDENDDDEIDVPSFQREGSLVGEEESTTEKSDEPGDQDSLQMDTGPPYTQEVKEETPVQEEGEEEGDEDDGSNPYDDIASLEGDEPVVEEEPIVEEAKQEVIESTDEQGESIQDIQLVSLEDQTPKEDTEEVVETSVDNAEPTVQPVEQEEKPKEEKKSSKKKNKTKKKSVKQEKPSSRDKKKRKRVEVSSPVKKQRTVLNDIKQKRGKPAQISLHIETGMPSNNSMKQLLRRSGMVTEYKDVYDTNKIVMRAFVREITRGAVLNMALAKRKTVSKLDIQRSSKTVLGMSLYG